MSPCRVCRGQCGCLPACKLYSSPVSHLLPGGCNLPFYFPVLSPLSDEAIIIAAGAFTQPHYFTSLSPSNIFFVPQLKIGLSFMNRDDTMTLFTRFDPEATVCNPSCRQWRKMSVCFLDYLCRLQASLPASTLTLLQFIPCRISRANV